MPDPIHIYRYRYKITFYFCCDLFCLIVIPIFPFPFRKQHRINRWFCRIFNWKTHKLKICRFGIQQFMWQKFPAIMWTMWKFVLFRSLGLWRETKQKKCRCLVSVLILTENFFLYVTLLKIIFYDRYNCHTLTMNGHLLCGKKETIYSFMLMQWLTIVLCRLSTPERNSLRKRWRKNQVHEKQRKHT